MKITAKIFTAVGILSLSAMMAMAGSFDEWLPGASKKTKTIPMELGSATITATPPTVLSGRTATTTLEPVDVNGYKITPYWSDLCGRNPQFQWSGPGVFVEGASKTTVYSPPTAPGTYTIFGTITEGPVLYPNVPLGYVISTETRTRWATATVVVVPQQVASIDIVPKNFSLVVDGSQTMTLTVRNSLGEIIPGVKGTWSSSDINVNPIYGSETQLNAGTQARTGTVGVTVVDGTNTFSTWTTVTILAGPPAKVDVSPLSKTLSIGQTQSFAAAVKDKYNNVLSNVVNWTLGENLGTLSPATSATTLFTAGTPGTTILTAATGTGGTAQGTATIVVEGIKFIPSQVAGKEFRVELGENYSGIATITLSPAGTFATTNGTFTNIGTITFSGGKGSVTCYVSTYTQLSITRAGTTSVSNTFWIEGGRAVRVILEGIPDVVLPGRPLPSGVTARTVDQWNNPAALQAPAMLEFGFLYIQNGVQYYVDVDEPDRPEYSGSPPWYLNFGEKSTTFYSDKFPRFFHNSEGVVPVAFTGVAPGDEWEIQVGVAQSN